MAKKSLSVRRPSNLGSVVLPPKSERYPESARDPRAMLKSLHLDQLKLNHQSVGDFAKRIGKNLLRNEEFLDKLADALDGVEISDGEQQEYDSESEQSPTKTIKDAPTPSSLNHMNYGLNAAMGSIKEEGHQSRDSK